MMPELGEPYPLRFVSAESLPREVAPPDYFPMEQPGPVVYDDEIDDLEPGPWRRFFAGGSNRPYWIKADYDGDVHFVENTGRSYEAYGPEYGVQFQNPYDAFYTAEQHCA